MLFAGLTKFNIFEDIMPGLGIKIIIYIYTFIIFLNVNQITCSLRNINLIIKLVPITFRMLCTLSKILWVKGNLLSDVFQFLPVYLSFGVHASKP